MSGDTFNAGLTTVTCTATDDAGNEDTCTFQVTVGKLNCGQNHGRSFCDFMLMTEVRWENNPYVVTITDGYCTVINNNIHEHS